MKAYIAFSIHGTNAFIVATRTFKSISEIQKLGKEFRIVRSRRPDVDPMRDGEKLEWDALCVKEDFIDSIGKAERLRPMRSPALIISKFKKLEAMGWKVDKKAFVARHFPVGKKKLKTPK